MKSYERNISASLTFQKVILLICLVAVVYFAASARPDYCVFSTLFIIVLWPFPVTGVTLTSSKLVITKYYFGFVPINYTFTKDQENTDVSIIELDVDYNPPFLDSGSFLNLFIILYPTKTRREKFLLLYERNEKHRKLYIKLTPDEHHLVSDFLQQLN